MDSCASNDANDQVSSDLTLLQDRIEKFNLGSSCQLVYVQAFIRGYLARKHIKQNKPKSIVQIATNFKAFKAYFGAKICDEIYQELEDNGMYFKAEDIGPSWIKPTKAGVDETYLGEINEKRIPNGRGIWICMEEDSKYIYEGDWYDGEHHGKGRKINNLGLLYVGDWVYGNRHGKGFIRYPKGKCYEGDWKDDRCHGFGHQWNTRNIHWDGQFQFDRPHGLARSWSDEYSYYGFFKYLMHHGKGWMVLSNGTQYIDTFLYNSAIGKGTLKYKNGNIYKGYVANYKKSGFGTLEIKGEGLYKGKFKDDKAVGDFLFISYSGERKKHHIQRKVPGESRIKEGEAAQDVEELKKKGIRNIVRVLYNEDVQKLPDINYHIIPVKDSEKENISQYFPEAIKFIHNILLSNEKVLVHCYKGISRSPTIILAYIIAAQKESIESAWNLIKHKRRIVRPNSGFIKQLKDYDFSQIAL
ncbi:unnamed protein product [Blepharisma stoltei]|uniref:Protein-tyrosine-phosphatase n=1 Tax=Blepharisma stoltei TaxID=1481888 RepID=A0AAU9K9K2_9CILI|nr:unnamed protein product [Blepharisma stoltei]